MEKKHILTGAHAAMKLRRMAYEILEENPDETEIILAGILDSGLVVATQLKSILSQISAKQIHLISIRMDKQHPSEIIVDAPMDFDGRTIILVDDVTNSGKTLLYALKPFLECYPKKIQTLVLVERSHKAYPIHPDYVGLRLATTLLDHVCVEYEGGEITGAFIE
jgi:pyrimidine operon attenuation protein/uracil phosphoribosyltransferase